MSRAWNDLLLSQAGVVSRAQALAHGVPARTIARWVAERRWRRIHPGVYLVGGHSLTDQARIRAAWLWGGPGSVVGGPAAALWLGMLDRAPGPVDITIGRELRRRPPPGVRLRRRDLDPLDRVTVRGVGVTEPALTVLETAAVLHDGAGFLDRALQQQHVRFEALHEAYCRSVGARGMGRARELLVACADRADSAAERRLIGLLRRAGITGFVWGTRSAERQSTSRSRTPGWRSSSTGGRGTPTRPGSPRTGRRGTRWSRRAGPCYASPGESSRSIRTGCWHGSGRSWCELHDRSTWEVSCRRWPRTSTLIDHGGRRRHGRTDRRPAR